MKNRFYRIIAVTAVSALLSTSMVFAAPFDTTNSEQIEENTEDAAEDTEETTTDGLELTEKPENTVEDTAEGTKDAISNGYVSKRFDDMGEFIVESRRSDFNDAQVNFSCTIPEGFTHGVILEIENAAKDVQFRLVATNTNSYLTRMAVPSGDYHIINCYVDGDTAMDYPMVMPEDFSIKPMGTFTVTSTLENYAQIKEEADRRLHPEKYEKEDEEEAIEEKNSKILPWRRITHTGSGDGEISITSDSLVKEPVDLKVVVTSDANPEKLGEFKYSSDGGETWSNIIVLVPDKNYKIYNWKTGAATGITINFRKGEFISGDEYSFQSPIEYLVDESSYGGGIIHLTSEDIIYGKNYDIEIEITKTGGLGEGTFQFRRNAKDKWSEDIIIPADGIFEIPETGLTAQFYLKDEEKTFMITDYYYSKIKGDMSQRSMAPYIIGIIAVFIAIIFVAVCLLRSKKEKPWEYTINVYHPVELKKKRK